MVETDERIERLITDETGECCDSDIEEKEEELREFREVASEDYGNEIQVLSTMASETRYKILRILKEAENDVCVCEFDAVLDVSESAISHATSELRKTGLVERRKEGKWRYYSTTERAESILDSLDSTRSGGL